MIYPQKYHSENGSLKTGIKSQVNMQGLKVQCLNAPARRRIIFCSTVSCLSRNLFKMTLSIP